jgi:hypothetical protein
LSLPEHNLYDVGTYLHRDIVQALYRFHQQLGKYEAYLKYLRSGTKENFRPQFFLNELSYLDSNVRDLQGRIATCKDRANGSLSLVRVAFLSLKHLHCKILIENQINNYIALQQARLANEQARIASQVAVIQMRDSQSTKRLSIAATIFLPLTFATVRRGFSFALHAPTDSC